MKYLIKVSEVQVARFSSIRRVNARAGPVSELQTARGWSWVNLGWSSPQENPYYPFLSCHDGGTGKAWLRLTRHDV